MLIAFLVVIFTTVSGHKVANSDENMWSQIMCLVTLDANKEYTFSENVSGPLVHGCVNFLLQNSDGTEQDTLVRVPVLDDGKEHRVSYNFTVTSKDTYRVFFTNAKTMCLPKLEYGELSTPIQELGGDNPNKLNPSLFRFYPSKGY